MKILITAPNLNPDKNVSGISSVVSNILENNKKQEYYHYLLGSPDKRLNKILWFWQLCKQIFGFPFFIYRNKIELVHQNIPFNPNGVAREFIINSFCRILRIPVVLHIHGGIFLMNGIHNPIFRKLSKTILNYSKKVIVLSQIEKQALEKHLHYKRAQVLCNSINISTYTAKKNKEPGEIKTILFLGRIHESKGVDDIIDSFNLLSKQVNFKFILCGDGPLREHFVNECTVLLAENFEYKGVVSGKEKLRIIQISDIFLLPSRYGEGMPMALLETMAAGLVPVVTNDASMKYVVNPYVNGLRVEKNNPKELTNKLKELLENEHLYQSLSENAIDTIKNNYNIIEYVTDLNNIYKSV